MGWDIVLVVICVAVAAWFMGRRMYRVVKNSGGCSCNCEKSAAGKCDGSGCAGRELTPLNKKTSAE